MRGLHPDSEPPVKLDLTRWEVTSPRCEQDFPQQQYFTGTSQRTGKEGGREGGRKRRRSCRVHLPRRQGTDFHISIWLSFQTDFSEQVLNKLFLLWTGEQELFFTIISWICTCEEHLGVTFSDTVRYYYGCCPCLFWNGKQCKTHGQTHISNILEKYLPIILEKYLKTIFPTYDHWEKDAFKIVPFYNFFYNFVALTVYFFF